MINKEESLVEKINFSDYRNKRDNMYLERKIITVVAFAGPEVKRHFCVSHQ